MAHDVFISCSSSDKPTADAVCAVLERNAIRCWIAPRDILPGLSWSESIINGINGARVMVLVFSGHANSSPQVEREIERAVNRGIPVIPMRVENISPNKSLEYFISTPHWLDAFTPPLEQHLERLAEVVRRVLDARYGGTQAEGEPIQHGTAGSVTSNEAAPDLQVSTPASEPEYPPVQRKRTQNGILILAHVGRLDTQTTLEFQSRLLAEVSSGNLDIILDFSSVEYISSAGLRCLMAAVKAKPKERRIALASLRPLVEEQYILSRFNHVLPAFGSVEEGVTAWSKGAVRVHFWGTRGSLPVTLNHQAKRTSIREALLAARNRRLLTAQEIDAFIDKELPFSVRGTFGGNTSCVEIATGRDEYLLCDLGSGVREFGNHVLAKYGPGRPNCFNIFLSHVHWDHIMGFPFFAPAYIPGNRLRIHGCHKVLREALERQHAAPSFPVEFSALGSTIEFIELEPGVPYEVAGFSVTAMRQAHGGDSYGYRFERDGRAIIYSTDCEHKAFELAASYPFVDFYRDADLLIFDTMYSLADVISVKDDWGHSSNLVAVELAQLAKAKRLVLFHHEPAFDDAKIEGMFAETVRFEEISHEGHRVEVIVAYDGLEITV